MQEEDEEIEVEMVAEHVVEDFPPPALDVGEAPPQFSSNSNFLLFFIHI